MWLLGRGAAKPTPGTQRPVATALREAPNALSLPSILGTTTSAAHSSLSPTPLNESPSLTAPRNETVALAMACEEKRVAREKQWLEDLVVFQGGAIKDHPSFGRYMIMRDFLHHALYHPRWGYHPKMQKKYKSLVTTGFFEPLAFSATRGRQDYEACVEKLQESTPTFITTSQLFQPVYSWVYCEYMLHTMRAKFHPGEPLVIYEFGAGGGAFAQHFLDFLAEHHADVYATCEYHLLELSPVMIELQRSKLIHHANRVRMHNISLYNWTEMETRRCFVVALDVLSQMPHDLIVWTKDGACYQQHIEFKEKDNLGNARDRWEPATDPLILRYLRYSLMLQEQSMHALKVLCLTDGRDNIDPPRWKSIEPTLYDPTTVVLSKVFAMHNPFRQMWVPTGQLLMFETMAKYFPRHHAVLGDWNTVMQPISGYNGPVVQCKLRLTKDFFLRRATDHFLANAGMVDVCFPTDFEQMKILYNNVCGQEKEIGLSTHPEFFATHGGDKTQLFNTKTGWNPLLEDLKLYSVFTSHHPAEE